MTLIKDSHGDFIQRGSTELGAGDHSSQQWDLAEEGGGL